MLSISAVLRTSVVFLLAVVAASAQSPVAEITNATLIGPEGITITAVSSPTAVLQFGVGSTWCSTITAPKLPLLVSYVQTNLALCPFDPAPNVAKSLVAQQQTAAYTVTYTNAGSTTKVVKTVPALPVVTPPSPLTATYVVTITGTTAVPTSGALPSNLTLTNVVVTAVKQ